MDHKRAVLRSWLNRARPVSLYTASTSVPQAPLRCQHVVPEQYSEVVLASSVQNRRRTQLYARHIHSEPRNATPAAEDSSPRNNALTVKLPPKIAMKYPNSRQKPLQVSFKPVSKSDPNFESTQSTEEPPCTVILKPKKRAVVNHTIETGRWLTLQDTSHHAKRFLAKADAELFEGPIEAPYIDSTIDDDAATPPVVLEHYARHTLQVLRAALATAVSDRTHSATTQWTHSAK